MGPMGRMGGDGVDGPRCWDAGGGDGTLGLRACFLFGVGLAIPRADSLRLAGPGLILEALQALGGVDFNLAPTPRIWCCSRSLEP
jgi:hypothetical protein